MIRKLITLWSWDVRVRNDAVAGILQDLVEPEALMLDAGCGENRLTDFFSTGRIIGLDLQRPTSSREVVCFILGSILRLPFSEDSFDWSVSIDVLEHLPEDLRVVAIREMVRVAKSGVVIAFPFDELPRSIDERYFNVLRSRHRPIPEWLNEHLQQRYPQIEAVLSSIDTAAADKGLGMQSSVHYSEDIRITKILRWFSGRSTFIYIFMNILFGIFSPIMSKNLTRQGCYRAILVARFQ